MITINKKTGLKKIMVTVVVLALISIQPGCTISNKSASTSMTLFDALGRTKDTSAFGADKIFGIVSITAEPYITQVDADSSLSGAFSALSSDKGFFENSQQMLDKSIPTVFSSMSKTNNYLLLPEKNVTGDSNYANTKTSGNSIFGKKNIARGYKRISDKKNLASLARDLGLDAAVHVNISYGYSIDGTNYNGLVQVGKNFATVKVDLMAVNQDGKVIWKESDATVAKSPVSSSSQVGDAADFKKLEPHLLQSLRATLGKIMSELNT
ncbi:MAG: hypothetical protein OES20_11965 [Gammaproteobacteria bacterium]|nr:hypothetical protein [Gammaproteobacteria bacterium]